MPIVIGADTETNEGPPISIQFYSEHLPRISGVVFVNEQDVLRQFFRHLSKHCTRDDLYVIYCHNLRFDMPSIFYSHKEELVRSRSGDFAFSVGDWEVSGVFGNVNFARFESSRARVLLLDSASWYMTSLARVAEMVCPDLPKLSMPEGLGSRNFTRKDSGFIEYAMRDAVVAYHAGCQIDRMHDVLDIPQSVSVANMASLAFTQNYIDERVPIWNTGQEINVGAVASYHGGKNNVRPGAAPMWHENVDAWDVSSAYPHAMTHLPAFSRRSGFAINRVMNKRARTFPEHGVYQVSGSVPPCDWPVIFDHDFKPIRGEFSNVWVTGYELNEARRLGEISLRKVRGHFYRTEDDPVTVPAMARYVKDFYHLKSTATDPTLRYMYKILLNSLYGKFIELREQEDATGALYWKAGRLYHPFMATLITGHTRAVMHRLEHETEALHTATDGIFCPAHKSPEGRVFTWAPPEGLGAIEPEGRDLDLCILRNKLYLAYEPSGKTDVPESCYRPGFSVVKFAKHGFQGKLEDLEAAANRGTRTYEVEKPNTLRDALNRGKVPNKFERHTRSLKVGPIRGTATHGPKRR